MKLSRTIRIVLWVLILSLATIGVPLAGAVPLVFKKEDETSFTTELVEERQKPEQSGECIF
jgi:hypothetical protein